jgi:hypothetical protein
MSDIRPTPDDLLRQGPADLAELASVEATRGPWGDSEERILLRLARTALPAWVRRAQAAEAFKAWVHGWLDAAGVPYDPDPEHTREHGCRISGRLRYLLSCGRKEAEKP